MIDDDDKLLLPKKALVLKADQFDEDDVFKSHKCYYVYICVSHGHKYR